MKLKNVLGAALLMSLSTAFAVPYECTGASRVMLHVRPGSRELNEKSVSFVIQFNYNAKYDEAKDVKVIQHNFPGAEISNVKLSMSPNPVWDFYIYPKDLRDEQHVQSEDMSCRKLK